MFSAVCYENPEIARKLAEVFTGRKIVKVHNLRQQDWVSIDPVLKKVRLDVTFEGDSTIYCIEMQVGKEKELAERIRYYQSAKDIEQINKGGEYKRLQPVYIIFICDYDPFGDGLQKYTFRNRCDENGRILEDHRAIIVVNTRGTSTGNSSLNSLLSYIHTGKKNDEQLTEEIEEAADKIRYNKDWRERFMTVGEMVKREAAKEAKRMARKMAKEMAEDMAKDMAKDMARDMAKDMAQDMARDMASEMVAGMAAELAEEKVRGIQNTVLAMRSAGTEEEQILQIVSKLYDLTPEQYSSIILKMI